MVSGLAPASVSAAGGDGLSPDSSPETVQTAAPSPTPLPTLHIAAILSLSGPASTDGLAMKEGIELGKTVLEGQGFQIEIKYEDDASDAKLAGEAVRRMKAAGFRIIIGPAVESAAGAPEPGLLFKPNLNSELAGLGPGDAFYFFSPATKAEAALSRWFEQHETKSIGIFVTDSSWGKFHRDLFRRVAAKLKLKILVEETVSAEKESDGARSLIARAKGEAPDAILDCSSSESSARLLKGLEDSGIRTSVLGTELAAAKSAGLLPKEAAFVEGYAIEPHVSEFFTEAFKKWSGHPPGRFTSNAYDVMLTLGQAAQAVGAEPAAIRSYLHTRHDVAGASGRIRFDAKHDVDGPDYFVLRVLPRRALRTD